MPEAKQFSVRVPDDIAETLVARTSTSGKSMSDVIRELIHIALTAKEAAATPVNAMSGNGEPTAVSAAVAAEVKPYFDQISLAWTALTDQMQDMASAIEQSRKETESVKAQVKLLRRDLRTLVRTLDDCLSHEGQTTTPPAATSDGDDHA